MTDRKNWPLGVSTCWSAPGKALYRALSQEGIRFIEYSGGSTDFLEEVDFVHNAEQILREIHSYDIEVSSAHLPFCPFEKMDPTSKDADVRCAIVAYQGELLRACAHAGIPIAVLHPSGEPYDAFERGERMKYAADTLRQLARIAEENGIKLAIENLPRTCLCNIHEEMTMLFHEIPSLYACFDMNHSLRQSNPDFIRALGKRIITVHASDYDMIDERHLLPFLGKNNWHEIMKALEDVDYDGIFTFEVSNKGVLPTQCLTLSYNKLMEI